MTKFIALFYTVLIMLLVAVVSYSMQKSEENFSPPKYTIGVVLKAMDSEHWLSVRSGMTEAAQRNNMRLIVITAENETAFAEQNKIISDLLDNDIDALIVAPTNINHTKEFVDAAQKKNIPVFSIDEEIDGIIYIGSNNYLIGEMAAAFMEKNLPAGAEVSVISGSANQNAHIQRTAGFVNYIEKNSALRIGTTIAAETQYRQAMTQAEKLFRERPNTRGIFVTSAIMTLGVIEATEKNFQAVTIVGVDTQNDAIMAVKSGNIDALISQDGHESGKLAIEVVTAYLNGQPTEKNNFISNELITSDNAEHFLLQEDF
ncbi:MAG: substrate-binding domain-containing protein [Quinella sp. 3Q1]|nr:substrate-binding domain-containing protein [Quinella sp. 3Q1]MBR6888584.1 substrate-binding domain-containing protein [Selenomonadaceae bacterium]